MKGRLCNQQQIENEIYSFTFGTLHTAIFCSWEEGVDQFSLVTCTLLSLYLLSTHLQSREILFGFFSCVFHHSTCHFMYVTSCMGVILTELLTKQSSKITSVYI